MGPSDTRAMGRNSINTLNWWVTLRIYRVLSQSGLINNNWRRNKEINAYGSMVTTMEKIEVK